MKTKRQWMMITALILFFVLLNVGMFQLFTKKCINDYSEGLQAKSIELDQYLPFDEHSEIVKLDGSLHLRDDLPVLDGAAALYPVFSAFFHAVYPEDAQSFDGRLCTGQPAADEEYPRCIQSGCGR